MPSRENVVRPVTLICPARSGSSLAQMIFHHHPQFQTVGETGNLLFYTWFGLTESEEIVVRDKEQQDPDGYRRRAGQAVREMVLSLFPSSQQYWMQKPINAPEVYWYFEQNKGKDKFASWYWNGMKAIFPQASVFTILRDPRDVAISAIEYFKITESEAWYAIERVFDLLLYNENTLSSAIFYDDLVNFPERTVRYLFKSLEIDFDAATLKAFDFLYVQTPPENGKPWSWLRQKVENEPKEQTGFSRRLTWESLDVEQGREAMSKAKALWHRFGQELA